MAFRRSTVRLRSAPLCFPPRASRNMGGRSMQSWRAATILAVLSACLLFAPGCASEQRTADYDDTPPNIERPAQPLEDEETLTDKIGEVGVVLLVIGGVAAGI